MRAAHPVIHHGGNGFAADARVARARIGVVAVVRVQAHARRVKVIVQTSVVSAVVTVVAVAGDSRGGVVASVVPVAPMAAMVVVVRARASVCDAMVTWPVRDVNFQTGKGEPLRRGGGVASVGCGHCCGVGYLHLKQSIKK